MIRITVYAGHSFDHVSDYEPSTTVREVADRDVSETLRLLGLEWRQADYFTGRQTVITLDPIPGPRQPDVKGLIRAAAEALEQTGML